MAIGVGLGLIALAASVTTSRRAHPPDDGWITAALATASIVALLALGQLGVGALATVAVGTLAGAAIGRVLDARAWALDALLAAIVSLLVVLAALPDTEGASLLGAALVPVAVGAIVRRTWWLGAAAGAATAALVAAVGVIAVDAAAGRTQALVITAVGAVVCALLVVVVARVVLAPRFTSGRERPSR